MKKKITNWFKEIAAREEGLHTLLILLAVIIFVIYPLQIGGVVNYVLVKAFLSLLTVVGVWTVSRKKRDLALVILIAVLSFIFDWFRTISDERWVVVTDLVTTFLFQSILAYLILLRTLAPGPVNLFRVEGSVIAYLLFGVIFATVYTLIFTLEPNSFNFSNPPQSIELSQGSFMYFSFITLTTIGYGDIQPITPLAQSVAMMEGLIGQLFPAILIARLVSQSLAK